MIFELMHHTYDGSFHLHFEGPPDATADDFYAICDRLMNEAALDIIENEKNDIVGYNRLVRLVAKLLPRHGYKEVILSRVMYQHGISLDNNSDPGDGPLQPSVFARAVIHNAKQRERWLENRERKRAAKELALWANENRICKENIEP